MNAGIRRLQTPLGAECSADVTMRSLAALFGYFNLPRPPYHDCNDFDDETIIDVYS